MPSGTFPGCVPSVVAIQAAPGARRSRGSVSFPNLKPSTATISLRLPKDMLDEMTVLANQRDVPYQSPMKVYLAERLAEELATITRPGQRASA
ncbi:MAG: CopG family antitoxin [Gemmatimonadaceae bacterium]